MNTHHYYYYYYYYYNYYYTRHKPHTHLTCPSESCQTELNTTGLTHATSHIKTRENCRGSEAAMTALVHPLRMAGQCGWYRWMEMFCSTARMVWRRVEMRCSLVPAVVVKVVVSGGGNGRSNVLELKEVDS